MKAYTYHEKKLFGCFKIWYGKTGRNGEKTLSIGIGTQNRYDGKRLYALCICFVWVWFNVGLERVENDR